MLCVKVFLSFSVLTFIGVFFDIIVWYLGRNLDLYGSEEDDEDTKKDSCKNASIVPNERWARCRAREFKIKYLSFVIYTVFWTKFIENESLNYKHEQ